MRKRLQIGLAVLLVSSGGLIGWLVLRNPEPSYKGRRLSEWVAGYDTPDSTSFDAMLRADEAVRAIGTNAFPWLDRMLCATDPLWKRVLLALNARQSFVNFPVTPAQVIRNRAVNAFPMGAAGKVNVLELSNILRSKRPPEVRCSVATVLSKIGPDARAALPALWNAAVEPDTNLQLSAKLAIINIQRDAELRIR